MRRIGTRWCYPPMGGPPTGLRWEAVHPLMDHLGLDAQAWTDLLDDLQVMEAAAIETIHEFAPNPKGKA